MGRALGLDVFRDNKYSQDDILLWMKKWGRLLYKNDVTLDLVIGTRRIVKGI